VSREQTAESKEQKRESGGQRAGSGKQISESTKQRTESRKVETKVQKAGNTKQGAERQKVIEVSEWAPLPRWRCRNYRPHRTSLSPTIVRHIKIKAKKENSLRSMVLFDAAISVVEWHNTCLLARTPLLHCCYTVVTLLFRCCLTLLLHL
jgi:hypothetical protein